MDNPAVVILWACLCLLVMLAMAGMSNGCTDRASTVRAVEAIGLTDVKVGGYAFWGCGRGDLTNTEFTATNVRGQYVSGIVCCGWFKACTVRFE